MAKKKSSLALHIKSLNDVTEVMREFYEEDDDGEFDLITEGKRKAAADDDDGDDDAAKYKKLSGDLDKQRKLAATADKEKRDLLKKLEAYGKLTPERAGELEELDTKLGEIEDGEMIAKGQFDAVINKRTKTMRDKYEKQIKDADDAKKKLEGDYNRTRDNYRKMLVGDAIIKNVTKLAVPKDNTIDDIVALASKDWTLDDEDKLVPTSDDLTDEKGDKHTLETYAKMFVKNKAHMFETGAGGGASGSGDRKKKETIKTIHTDDPNKSKYIKEIASGKMKVITDDKE